jgi:hypothetical protein
MEPETPDSSPPTEEGAAPPTEEGAAQPAEGKGPTPVGGILALVGGALLAIGSFLDWAEVSGTGTSVTATGIDGTDGWITLGAGVLALAAGSAIVRRTGGRGVAILAIVAGVIGGGVGLYDAATAKDSFLDSAAEELAREFGGSVQQLRALLDAAIQVGELAVTVMIGLYVVIAGGVLAIVGGAISLGRGSVGPALAASATPAATQAPTVPAPDAPGEPPQEVPSAGPPPPPPAPHPQSAAPDIQPPPAPGSEDTGMPGIEPPPSPWAIPEPSDRGEPGHDEDDER